MQACWHANLRLCNMSMLQLFAATTLNSILESSNHGSSTLTYNAPKSCALPRILHLLCATCDLTLELCTPIFPHLNCMTWALQHECCSVADRPSPVTTIAELNLGHAIRAPLTRPSLCSVSPTAYIDFAVSCVELIAILIAVALDALTT